MEVLLFGIAKDIVGSTQMDLSEWNSPPSSVGELKDFLCSSFPEFGKLSSLAVAVNSEYAQDTVVLEAGDEIAIIPPVSGG
ncbi:MoaD/ThiS family protein [Ulvibacterium marinum]|uniref:MoaD/ThiS family protein n=1 Tax=Ulvibacterium marinum TaxID=2419782 RepID=UPI002494BC65|nr:MoaD/ThiS family protein [Ulvibacterium marinum]